MLNAQKKKKDGKAVLFLHAHAFFYLSIPQGNWLSESALSFITAS